MSTVLLLPGWHNSGPTHWQSLWQDKHGYTRVAQHDWAFPLRGDWMAQLEAAVLAHNEVVLAAGSLGISALVCLLNNGDHGLSEGGWASGVCQKYKINSIPRYMIIDKSGTIVRPDAPRPSSPETLDLFLKLME